MQLAIIKNLLLQYFCPGHGLTA